MTTFAADIVLGIGVGLLLGAASAFLLGIVGFGLEYSAESRLPTVGVGAAALVFGVATLVQFGLAEPSADAVPRVATAAVVVVVLGTYGHSQGQEIADRLPRSTSQPTERRRRLSEAAFDAIDGAANVTISATGEVRDMDGHPPLSPDIREALSTGSWQLPADLPLVELESRLEDRLRSTYGLAAADISIDARGRATIAAAPPKSGTAANVPDGWRAVTLDALVPTGVAPGEEIRIVTEAGTTEGILLGATDGAGSASDQTTSTDQYSVGAEGCHGHVSVAVSTTDAGTILQANHGRLLVFPRGENHDYEALSHLKSAGTAVRRITVTEAIRERLLEHEPDIHLLAVFRADDDTDGWLFEPSFRDTDEPDADAEQSDTDDAEGPIARYAKPGTDVFVAGETTVLGLVTDDQTSAPKREVVR